LIQQQLTDGPVNDITALILLSAAAAAVQAGQFIGARADFVPEQICAKLCLLQDKVPPMSPERAKQVRRDSRAGRQSNQQRTHRKRQ
jgi:predicted unusual protein kinase regulating ubiquinone biosynthesis (AarF/ABC1/UbiB family)